MTAPGLTGAHFDLLIADAEQPFSGWDFSYISGTHRMREAPLPWSYASCMLPYLRQTDSVLDMGTGGGEFLARFQPLPALTCATEGYPPNIPVARQRLEPLGVKVYEVSDDLQLPFAAESFDLVINRHESYAPGELLRVLKPGGRFITQQVGGQNDVELNRMLGAPDYDEFAHWDLDYAVQDVEEAGLPVIERQEAFPVARFFDIGAVVYYLKAVPWQIPDFTAERYRDALLDMHHQMQDRGYIDIPSHRFLLVAVKPNS